MLAKYAKRDDEGDSTVNHTFTENSDQRNSASVGLAAGIGAAGVFQIANTSYNSPLKNNITNSSGGFNE